MGRSRNSGAPKNRPSRRITSRIKPQSVKWMQEPANFCGHKPRKGGHRMVSGIVRSKENREAEQEIDDMLNDVNIFE